MITIEHLSRTLAGRRVLDGVDLEIAAGEVLAVVGPSGTGKSVLLKHVIGLLLPDAGDVRIGAESIVRCTPRRLSQLRRRMGYVFQDAALLDSLTVRQNLRLALDDDECRRNPMHAGARMHYALDMVNLDAAVLERTPEELSGGMRKRVGVARAIMNSPDILLYDEPTTGLDPANVLAINDLVLRTRDALGATSLVVTHDMASLPELADRVAFLIQGRIHFVGEPDEFFASDDGTVRAFIGGSRTSPMRRANNGIQPAIDNRKEAHDGRLFPRS